MTTRTCVVRNRKTLPSKLFCCQGLKNKKKLEAERNEEEGRLYKQNFTQNSEHRMKRNNGK